MAESGQRFEAGIGRLLAANPIDPKAREFIILKAEISVGSDEKNDFVIRDGTVSRRHAIISFNKGRLEIRDLGSMNGTFINGRRVVDSSPIDKGDKIRFGGADFVLLRSVVPAPAPVVPTRVAAVREGRTPSHAKRLRSFSARAIGELILVAFVVGFGTAQYLAYLLYHEENKLLLAKAVPLRAVQMQHSSTPTAVSPGRTEKGEVGGSSSLATPSAPPVVYDPTLSAPSGSSAISKIVSAALSLTRLVPGSGQQAGEQGRNFTLPDLQGKSVSLSSFRGRLVLLSFWATWCGACRSEMPSLENLYKNFHNDHFVVLTVSVDQQGLTAVQPFLQRTGYDFPVLLDQGNEVSTAYRVQGIPAAFIIDGTGRIVWNCAGSIDWSSNDLRDVIENLMPLA